MILDHSISVDLLRPVIPPRIQVKQGDTLAHGVTILLFANGAPWDIPQNTIPVIRWFAFDPATGESAQGTYDTLPNGVHAWQYSHNELNLVMKPGMFDMPGLVQADVALTVGETVLATCNFEFYVNPSPANGTEADYKTWPTNEMNYELRAVQKSHNKK